MPAPWRRPPAAELRMVTLAVPPRPRRGSRARMHAIPPRTLPCADHDRRYRHRRRESARAVEPDRHGPGDLARADQSIGVVRLLPPGARTLVAMAVTALANRAISRRGKLRRVPDEPLF